MRFFRICLCFIFYLKLIIQVNIMENLNQISPNVQYLQLNINSVKELKENSHNIRIFNKD